MPQTLTHSPAQIIRKLLLDQGLASSSGDWQCFYGKEPNSPDNVLSVFGTAGKGFGSAMVNGELMGHEGFQIRVRGKDYRTAFRRADKIQTELAEVVYQQVVTIEEDSVIYQYLIAAIGGVGDVLDNGADDTPASRHVFTINCTASIEEL